MVQGKPLASLNIEKELFQARLPAAAGHSVCTTYLKCGSKQSMEFLLSWCLCAGGGTDNNRLGLSARATQLQGYLVLGMLTPPHRPEGLSGVMYIPYETLGLAHSRCSINACGKNEFDKTSNCP